MPLGPKIDKYALCGLADVCRSCLNPGHKARECRRAQPKVWHVHNKRQVWARAVKAGAQLPAWDTVKDLAEYTIPPQLAKGRPRPDAAQPKGMTQGGAATAGTGSEQVVSTAGRRRWMERRRRRATTCSDGGTTPSVLTGGWKAIPAGQCDQRERGTTSGRSPGGPEGCDGLPGDDERRLRTGGRTRIPRAWH